MDRCPTCKRELEPRPRKPPTRVNGTTRAEDRAARRRAIRAETAVIREVVFKRAAGVCELCTECPPTELHHIEGGSGRRREQQGERNCVAICVWCHRKWHRAGAGAFAWSVRAWAERHGYEIPKSITKVA